MRRTSRRSATASLSIRCRARIGLVNRMATLAMHEGAHQKGPALSFAAVRDSDATTSKRCDASSSRTSSTARGEAAS